MEARGEISKQLFKTLEEWNQILEHTSLGNYTTKKNQPSDVLPLEAFSFSDLIEIYPL